MSRHLDDDEDDLRERDRELTLSTGAILAIFLGLILLCAVFFGFGYNLGRKSTSVPNAPLPVAAKDAEPAETGSSTFDNFKPSPGSPKSTSSTTTPPAPARAVETSTADKTPSSTNEPSVTAPAHTTPAPAARPVPPSAANPSPSTHASQQPAPAIAPGGAFVVQIAAISATHKDDAEMLSSALRGRGYTVSQRTDPQDKLIHVQVGPFATKADAEAMRERLVVDGYNPIIK
jgi:DedD protein